MSGHSEAKCTYISYNDLTFDSAGNAWIDLGPALKSQFWNYTQNGGFTPNGALDNAGWQPHDFKGENYSNSAETKIILGGISATSYTLEWSAYGFFRSADSGSDRQYMYYGVKSNLNGGAYSWVGMSGSDTSTDAGSVGNWDGYNADYGYYYYRTGRKQNTPIYCTRSAKYTAALTSQSAIGIQIRTSWDNPRNWNRMMYDSQFELRSLKLTFNGIKEEKPAGEGSAVTPFKLSNRKDFDILSSRVNANDDEYTAAHYTVEPDGSNGQTAYASGGRTINMGASAFNPIGTADSAFKGSFNSDSFCLF